MKSLREVTKTSASTKVKIDGFQENAPFEISVNTFLKSPQSIPKLPDPHDLKGLNLDFLTGGRIMKSTVIYDDDDKHV